MSSEPGTNGDAETAGGRPDLPGGEFRAGSGDGNAPTVSPPPPPAAAPIDGRTDLWCSMIGAGDAGKTSFIDSCEQACADPAGCHDPVRLEYVGGTKTKQQADRSALSVAEGHRLKHTDDVQEYDAYLTATWPATFWRAERQESLHLHFLDGPGGALFPLDVEKGSPDMKLWERRLIEEAQQADTIVLCIDSSQPQLDRITQCLRTILAAVAVSREGKPSPLPLRYRALRALRRSAGPRSVTLRRLQAKRFLLLLTKIDRLVSGPSNGSVRWRGRGPTPLAIARSLSPLEVACELVHGSNLMRIMAALRPGAELAVGLTSAWGFAPSGYPFMEDNRPVRLSNQPGDRRTADWQPFGVREVFHFLLDGRTGGPIERVTRDKVAQCGRHALDVPAWYFA